MPNLIIFCWKHKNTKIEGGNQIEPRVSGGSEAKFIQQKMMMDLSLCFIVSFESYFMRRSRQRKLTFFSEQKYRVFGGLINWLWNQWQTGCYQREGVNPEICCKTKFIDPEISNLCLRDSRNSKKRWVRVLVYGLVWLWSGNYRSIETIHFDSTHIKMFCIRR